MPIAAAALVPLLALPASDSQPKRGRTALKTPKKVHEDVPATAVDGSMALPIAVLELLQWRSDIKGDEVLLQHLSSLLQPLLRMATEQSGTHTQTDAEGTDRLICLNHRASLWVSAVLSD